MKKLLLVCFISLLTSSSILAQYTEDTGHNNFSLRVTGGVDLQSLEVDMPGESMDHDFGSQVSPNFGLELEYIFDFNNNKFRAVLGLNYQNYPEQVYAGRIDAIVTAKYSGLNIPFGFRYYIYMNDDAKIFMNAFYRVILKLDDPINTEYGVVLNDYPEAKSRSNFAFGFGFEYKKLGIECRYRFKSDLLADYSSSADLNSISLMLGYRLF